MRCFFDEIIHGTQYYRSPTPLPAEWEEDISNLEKYNIDAFQIRMNWRWNERRENEYDFSDIDRLLELAEKSGRKVIMKFLLECAPQYIYEKYDGTRIGSKGEKLPPGCSRRLLRRLASLLYKSQGAGAGGKVC